MYLNFYGEENTPDNKFGIWNKLDLNDYTVLYKVKKINMRKKIVIAILIISLIVTGCSYYDVEPINNDLEMK